MSDPYAVLGVPPDASLDDVRRAYYELVRTHSPEHDPETFKRIRAAYEQLVSALGQDELFRLQTPPDWVPNCRAAVIEEGFHPEDALAALQAWGDLGREDFTDDFSEVSL